MVDDEPQVLAAIEDELGGQYRVLLETSPASAIKRLEQEKLSVIISDQRMPGMSGHEFLARAQVVSDATRILITGYSDIEAMVSAVNQGHIFGYLSKPWDPDHLRLLVMKANEHFNLLQRLSGEQTLLHNLMDNIPDAIFFTDRAHRFLRVNRVLARALGLEHPSEAEGKSLAQFRSAPLTEEIEKEEKAILETGVPITDRVVRSESEDGQVSWHSVTRAPVRNEKGEIASIVGIRRDVTSRMLAEIELRKSEERFRLLVEGVKDYAIIMLDEGGRIVTWNDGARRLKGYAESEIAGQSMERFYTPEDLAAGKPARLLALAVAEGRCEDQGWRVRKDGTRFYADVVLTAMRDHAGALVGFTKITRDITERKASEEAIARLVRLYAVLSGINSLIVRVRDRQQLFEEVCRVAVEQGQLAMAWVGRLDAAAVTVKTIASYGPGAERLPEDEVGIGEDRPEGRGTIGQAVRERKIAMCNDIAGAPDVGVARRTAVGLGYGSVVSLPVVAGDEVVAVCVLYAPKPDFFDEMELRLLEEMAGDISFALEHIAKEEKLDYLALYDALTGLPNRTLFSDRLARDVHAANGSNGGVGVLLIDVERFRHFNDALGRHAGDTLLKLVAERLVRAAMVKEGVSRIGADLFAMALPNVRGGAEVARFVDEHLLPQLLLDYEIEGEEVRSSVRLGIAMSPDDGRDAETLLANAEAALKKAKSSGERYVFYAAEMNARVSDELRLETKLRQAQEKGQFILYYQPKVDIKSNRITGLEALIRWKDPNSGIVPPGLFIPILEETGLILEVGKWAIGRAGADHRRWIDKGLVPPRIAVNVSPIQLRRDDFVDTVVTALSANPGFAKELDIEITESAIMESVESHIPKLRALRDMGIGIAIDDFGTGYSSLAYIAKLPVSELKIDRAFIVNMPSSPDDLGIVTTIISLARGLELVVVAEGVETEEQAKILKLVKCNQMQGYFISKPRPPDEIDAMLARRKP